MKTLIALAVALTSPLAEAKISPELYQYFEQKLIQIEQAQSGSPGGSPWVLQDVNLDLTPTVGLGIDDALNLSLAPEIDFVLVPNSGS